MKTLAQIIATDATIYDAAGYIQTQGVEVADHGNMVRIGGTVHRKDELEISESEITSKAAGWTVKL